MVVSAQLKTPVALPNLTSSDYFYECEIFPAALIAKWRPAHIALFHNGKVIVTGVKDERTLYSVFKDLSSFLKTLPVK